MGSPARSSSGTRRPEGERGVWRSAGFSFDTGASLVMMTEQWHRLFQDVGRRLEDYLSLVQIDPCYRIIANHSNWWDGFFAFLVGRELGLTSHLLMDAESLGRYPVFRLAGALPGSGSRACLKPGAALWVFPPGARRPQGSGPRGCSRALRSSPCGTLLR